MHLDTVAQILIHNLHRILVDTREMKNNLMIWMSSAFIKRLHQMASKLTDIQSIGV